MTEFAPTAGPGANWASQRTLVERFISWPLVKQRLARYEAIARAFPLALLERHRESPPFFCHYMAWRLGTWVNEALIVRLEELLRHAERLPGWDHERGLLESAEYADYWSLMWQLQVAEHLAAVGSDVRWSRGGPDLSATINGDRLHVECYVYRKSFGIALFLEDVLHMLGNDIKFDHDYCLPFALPGGADTTNFLDKAMAPFLDPALLPRLREEARRRYPVLVSNPASTLVIYVEGDDADAYDPAIHQSGTGDPDAHVRVILREAVNAKAHSNQLANHHPNLVAVNFLVSADAQLAFHLRAIQPTVELPDPIDGVAIGAVGIDVSLQRSDLLLIKARDPLHPALRVVALPLQESSAGSGQP